PQANPEYRFAAGEVELFTLVATDVLAEGLNLQDCDKIINYDLHWNPVRLVQRFGRIDRIGSEHAVIFGFNFLPEVGIERCRAIAVADQRTEQDRDLADFGVVFDVVFSEQDLYRSGAIERCLAALAERGLTYQADGALWLKSESLGDEKDRVLRKSDGSFTYFLPDVAYHLDKAYRGADRSIDVWGADHHGYVPRMKAALAGLGKPDFFEAVLVQLVKVIREGEEVRFSKRAGDFVSLRELYTETGVDAARYFFLMRRGDSQFVFDIELARMQSEENPVYYVQYAHTRLRGIFRKAGIDPETFEPGDADLSQLVETDELDLIRHLSEWPGRLERAARSLEPHRVVTYLDELAKYVNAWYHHHRVIGEPPALERARLALARAAQIVLRNGLELIGVTAPDRM
ncbi:MAG: arginine--tRNA ligase, partial [Gemmatimonadales bacterium]